MKGCSYNVLFPGNKQKGGSSGSGSASGLLAPVQLSENLANFIGTGESMLSRSDVVKRMWEYIKQNNLQVNVLFLDITSLFVIISI